MTKTERTWGGLTGTQRAERRREQFLDAGLELFGTTGWAATTVHDVSAAAGLSPRYFYEQFADREACFGAVLQGVADEVQAIAVQSVGRPTEPRAFGEAVLTELIEYFLADRRKLRVALVESFATPEFRARRAELLRLFATLTSSFIASLHPDSKQTDPESLKLSAFVLSGGLAEALVEHGDGNLDVPADRLIKHFIGLYSQAALLATTAAEADA